MRSLLLGAGVVLAWSLGAAAAHAAAPSPATPTSKLLQRDILTNADLWERRPRMMAAGLGFTGIIGVPGLNGADLPASEAAVRAAGGTWNTVSCGTGATPALTAFTSASSPQNVAVAYGRPVTDADGLPVEFSWPLRPSTVGPTDFRVTLNTGERVTPLAAAVYPNAEENERSVAVLFGRFGNRLAAGTPGARYVVRTEVVRDATPLQLVGTGGRIVSALGMAATIGTSPYGDPDAAAADRTGPRLVAAKVSRLSTRGETAPAPFDGALPNDGRTLYGDAARFRIRVFTTGGFSPDGVRAVFPTEFARYFRLRARAGHGRTVALTRTGRDYRLGGHTVRILGLADLGRRQDAYDDCYTEDKDNQIDIVLAGDERAVRRITDVEIPADGLYSGFYNPGGPGNAPTPGVRYTVPGPTQVQPITDALREPLTVTWRG